jgi:beta-glucosidase
VWDEDARIDGAVDDWLHRGALRVQPGEYRIAAGSSADALEVVAELRIVD